MEGCLYPMSLKKIIMYKLSYLILTMSAFHLHGIFGEIFCQIGTVRHVKGMKNSCSQCSKLDKNPGCPYGKCRTT